MKTLKNLPSLLVALSVLLATPSFATDGADDDDFCRWGWHSECYIVITEEVIKEQSL